MIEKCYQADIEGWKVSKFVKDPADYNEVCRIIKQNFQNLKNIFTSVTVRDSFPCMNTIEMATLLQEANLIDN